VLPSACIDSVGVLDEAVSRLNIPAHMPPVNAWPVPLRTHTHHSGPMWIATPSSYETFTHCHLAGFHRRTNAWPEWRSCPVCSEGLVGGLYFLPKNRCKNEGRTS
jgi:hypothetical protein